MGGITDTGEKDRLLGMGSASVELAACEMLLFRQRRCNSRHVAEHSGAEWCCVSRQDLPIRKWLQAAGW
jgi:hypothetical protein